MREYIEQMQGVFLTPLGSQIEDYESADSLREVLDILHPYKLYNAMIAGGNNFVSEFGEGLSSEAYRAVKRIFSELEDGADELMQVWNVLDEYERTEILNYASEGLFSDERFWGATIGSIILPGVGTLIGAFFGGRAAGKRLQNEATQVIQLYLNGVGNFVKIFSDFAEEFSEQFLYELAQMIQSEEESKRLPAGNRSAVDELERLVRMRNDGSITETEFRRLKQNLMSNM